MKTDQTCRCPNCKKPIAVVFDSLFLREDYTRGDYLLNGYSCWNCGITYTRLFNHAGEFATGSAGVAVAYYKNGADTGHVYPPTGGKFSGDFAWLPPFAQPGEIILPKEIADGLRKQFTTVGTFHPGETVTVTIEAIDVSQAKAIAAIADKIKAAMAARYVDSGLPAGDKVAVWGTHDMTTSEGWEAAERAAAAGEVGFV